MPCLQRQISALQTWRRNNMTHQAEAQHAHANPAAASHCQKQNCCTQVTRLTFFALALPAGWPAGNAEAKKMSLPHAHAKPAKASHSQGQNCRTQMMQLTFLVLGLPAGWPVGPFPLGRGSEAGVAPTAVSPLSLTWVFTDARWAALSFACR